MGEWSYSSMRHQMSDLVSDRITPMPTVQEHGKPPNPVWMRWREVLARPRIEPLSSARSHLCPVSNKVLCCDVSRRGWTVATKPLRQLNRWREDRQFELSETPGGNSPLTLNIKRRRGNISETDRRWNQFLPTLTATPFQTFVRKNEQSLLSVTDP
jgi:hypothetical protein